MQEVSKEKIEKIDKNIARYIIAFRKDFVSLRFFKIQKCHKYTATPVK